MTNKIIFLETYYLYVKIEYIIINFNRIVCLALGNDRAQYSLSIKVLSFLGLFKNISSKKYKNIFDFNIILTFLFITKLVRLKCKSCMNFPQYKK